MQIKGLKFKYIAFAMGVIALALGVWLLFFHSSKSLSISRIMYIFTSSLCILYLMFENLPTEI